MLSGFAREKLDIVLDPSHRPAGARRSAMKVVINSQVVLSRVPEGPIAPYLGKFAASLDTTGYRVKWIHRQVLLAHCFSQWLGRRAVALQDITTDHLTPYLRYRAQCLRPRCGDHAALAHLWAFFDTRAWLPRRDSRCLSDRRLITGAPSRATGPISAQRSAHGLPQQPVNPARLCGVSARQRAWRNQRNRATPGRAHISRDIVRKGR